MWRLPGRVLDRQWPWLFYLGQDSLAPTVSCRVVLTGLAAASVMYQRGWWALLISAILCTGAIMKPLKRLIGGLIVVSVAILAVLVAGHPVVAAPTLAASPIDGGPNGTSTGTWDGTSTSTLDGALISTACCTSNSTSGSTSDGTSGGGSNSASCCTSDGTSGGGSNSASCCTSSGVGSNSASCCTSSGVG